ncbi:MAG: hypothetical protein IKN81_08220 [Oscillospiraceae bacterium]|nr:hypothetical protein [Oscillospiraceae bacterium]
MPTRKEKNSQLPRGAKKTRRAVPMKKKSPVYPELAEVVEAASVVPVEPVKERKKPGRKPMTEEQKAEARAAREAKKSVAMVTAYVQFMGSEAVVNDLVEAAKADFKASHKRTKVESLRLYIKPEEYTAYYVINDSFAGQVSM